MAGCRLVLLDSSSQGIAMNLNSHFKRVCSMHWQLSLSELCRGRLPPSALAPVPGRGEVGEPRSRQAQADLAWGGRRGCCSSEGCGVAGMRVLTSQQCIQLSGSQRLIQPVRRT